MPSVAETQLMPHSLDELLSFPLEEVGKVDIGRANLLCAEGLPGAEGLVVEDHVQTLDEWSSRIGWMTQRHQSSYLNDPAR